MTLTTSRRKTMASWSSKRRSRLSLSTSTWWSGCDSRSTRAPLLSLSAQLKLLSIRTSTRHRTRSTRATKNYSTWLSPKQIRQTRILSANLKHTSATTQWIDLIVLFTTMVKERATFKLWSNLTSSITISTHDSKKSSFANRWGSVPMRRRPTVKK